MNYSAYVKCIFILLLLFLFGCKHSFDPNELSTDGQIAAQYLHEMGYEVVSYEGEGSISFTRSDLVELPFQQIWGVQYTEPDEYIDKRIDTIRFLIKNHPLDDQYDEGKTRATVMLFNHEVIGGWSFPYSNQPLVGGSYSIDGKTLEEVRGNYVRWKEEWDKKYGVN